MSFRIQSGAHETGTRLLHLSHLDALSSYDLRYILSLSLFFPLDNEYFKEFLQTLYELYPYSNSREAYRRFYDTTPIGDDLVLWITKLFTEVYHSVPTLFSNIPSPREWGPVYWRFLFDLQAINSQSEYVVLFLTNLLPVMLPCYRCQEHLLAYLEGHPIVSSAVYVWLADLRVAIAANNSRSITPILTTAALTLALSNSIPKNRATKHFSPMASIVLPPNYVSGKGCGGCANKSRRG